MNKVVDIYMPLDSRDEPNAEVWPVAKGQLEELLKVVNKCGWEAHVLNQGGPVTSVAQGLKVIQKAKGTRFINFFAGWAFPDFSVSPMWQLPKETPKLMLGSSIPDYPGAVGLLAALSGTEHVGIKTDRLFVEEFEKHDTYIEGLNRFLHEGEFKPSLPRAIDVPVSEKDRERAKKSVRQLHGSVYGAVGPRSMQMWNKISEADFLQYFGIAREGFDGLRLAKMTEKVPDRKAEDALNFLVEKGMDIRLGDDPVEHLTRDMVIFQMKAYLALLELKKEYGLDFMGVQDQLDWIDHYPATDLSLGLLNNRLRPETDGETVVTATEADDGAAVTMQLLKLLGGGDPVGFNDFRYWDSEKGIYWFVNSGALAPYFAHGRHDSLEGAWSERQTYMYFKKGGGTSSAVVRIPGVVTWARFFYHDHQLCLAAGRGITDVPTEEQWRKRSKRCSSDWPHWYIKLCGHVEWTINSNHPMTAVGDHLVELKAVAEELGIPFECADHCAPEDLA